VLRWILEKLKDNAATGARARANPKAWQLAEWMVQVLPRSRAAIQLREAGFLSTLERALQENYDEDSTVTPAPTSQNAREEESSESSATVKEEMKPSRKRKRPSPGSHTSSKRVALRSEVLETLFGALFNVVKSIANKAGVMGESEEVAQMEHMKMALRTESAQAARILKSWISAVNMLLKTTSKVDSVLPDAHLGLSLALRIWELRAIDADDPSGSSSDQFSAECLIPVLVLYARIQDAVKEMFGGRASTKVLRRVSDDLETLLARHLFAPSRAAFFTYTTQSDVKIGSVAANAEQLANNLTPLRAKIIQAAQIQDTSSPIPSVFLPLFRSIPQLLDMAVRMSPSRAPRNRIAERPWIQAVFIALAECAGCPLEPPEYPVPQVSLKAIEESLIVLSFHDVKIDSDVIIKLFRYHSGVESPSGQKKKVHWPLIAALINLDPSTFVSGPSLASGKSNGKPEDIARFLFDRVSLVNQNKQLRRGDDEMDIDCDARSDHLTSVAASSPADSVARNDSILESVIFPVMSAFARNRDLLGFIDRWDDQLCEYAPLNRSALKERHSVVWEDRSLGLELERLLEQSLTIPQIMGLFQRHAGRLNLLKKTKDDMDDVSVPDDTETIKKAYSSAVLLRALLWSIKSDEIIESLELQLSALLTSYADIICDKRCRSHTDRASFWVTLCRLLAILWPIKLHASLETQQHLLRPLIEQGTKDVSTIRKKHDERPVDSKTKAAALLFLLTVSDHLGTVPGWDDTLGETLRKALKTLSPSRLEATELTPMLEIVCTEFAHLLEYLEPGSRKESLHKLIRKIADQGLEASRLMAEPLSQHIFTCATTALREAYADAILEAVDLADEDVSMLRTLKVASLQMRPLSLSRDRREAILNKITESLISKSQDVNLLLSIMISLQEVPNATATISTDGSSFFGLAKSLHDNDCESANVLRLFQELMLRTLGHMLPNKDQAQNRRYLDAFQNKLGSIMKKPNRCYPARLAIVRAAWRTQKDDELVPWDEYLSLLTDCFANTSVPEHTVLAAFDEVSLEYFDGHKDRYQAVQDVLRPRLDTTMGVRSYGVEGKTSAVTTELRVLHHALIAKFRLYPDMEWAVQLSIQLLRDVSAEQQVTILRSIGNTFSSLPLTAQLALVSKLTENGANEDRSASYRLLHVLISAFDDKLGADPGQKEEQLAILPTVCRHLGESSTGPSFCALLDTVITIVRDKPSFTCQHSIECVLAVLVKLSSRNGPHLPSSEAEAIYTRICESIRLVLLLHRSRLGGRFHLLLPLLQNLLFCFFIPHGGRQNMLPPWLRAQSSVVPMHLSANNASQYTRLLSTLCSPTQSSVSKTHQNRGTSNNTRSCLNDPVKAAREYVSHYIYPLLATLCRFQLNGRLESGVRKKLMPGIWEVVGTAEMDKEALQAMYAGLDKSSREIWKGLWEEWKSQSKRGNAM
jgi:nucleolar pre-ribosomal-associated protein 2